MPVFNEFGLRDLVKSRFLFLLIAIILLVLVAPIVEEFADHALPAMVIRLSFTGVLLVALYSIADTNRYFMVSAALLAVAWLVVSWWTAFSGSVTGELIGGAILFVFLCLVNSRILLRLLRLDQANFDLLCAAAVVYILLAVGWSVSYSLFYMLDPSTLRIASGRELVWSDFMYFSLTTLTTLGYGDITPAHPAVRVWTTLEAASGVLYTTLLVARLVAIYVPQQTKPNSDE